MIQVKVEQKIEENLCLICHTNPSEFGISTSCCHFFCVELKAMRSDSVEEASRPPPEKVEAWASDAATDPARDDPFEAVLKRLPLKLASVRDIDC